MTEEKYPAKVEQAARAILNGKHTAIYEVPKTQRSMVHRLVQQMKERENK